MQHSIIYIFLSIICRGLPTDTGSRATGAPSSTSLIAVYNLPRGYTGTVRATGCASGVPNSRRHIPNPANSACSGPIFSRVSVLYLSLLPIFPSTRGPPKPAHTSYYPGHLQFYTVIVKSHGQPPPNIRYIHSSTHTFMYRWPQSCPSCITTLTVMGSCHIIILTRTGGW